MHVLSYQELHMISTCCIFYFNDTTTIIGVITANLFFSYALVADPLSHQRTPVQQLLPSPLAKV
jgi:hypothetical protein